jgi:anti-sigma regulatory factor (Ser/Thr protein kinase)/CheY-like chemotaxis protein
MVSNRFSSVAENSGASPMNRNLTTVAIRFEHDVVLARQRARQIAALLGFDAHDQVRIATAVSEIARNVFRYAGRGRADFSVSELAPPVFVIRIADEGPGISNLDQILDGQYLSRTGMGMGIIGARRLMDQFEIESSPQGTTVLLAKALQRRAPAIPDQAVTQIAEQLIRQPPQDPFEELQRQNQELLSTLAEVQRQKTELSQLNKELEDTNRGVVALYAELDERADYLRRASELKTQFLSNMTHEFRTPLNSILSLSRILLDHIDGPLTEEQERQVRFIQQGANDLSELVNDLLDLAKVEAGKVSIRPNDFVVRDLFGALRGMLKADPATSPIPIIVHTSKGLTASDRKKLEGRVVAVIPKEHQDRETSGRAIHQALARALGQRKQPANELGHAS